jgi:hypothetical protein
MIQTSIHVPEAVRCSDLHREQTVIADEQQIIAIKRADITR